jgi:hypothetical protein
MVDHQDSRNEIKLIWNKYIQFPLIAPYLLSQLFNINSVENDMCGNKKLLIEES